MSCPFFSNTTSNVNAASLKTEFVPENDQAKQAQRLRDFVSSKGYSAHCERIKALNYDHHVDTFSEAARAMEAVSDVKVQSGCPFSSEQTRNDPISEPFDQGIKAARAMEAVSNVKVQSGCPFSSEQTRNDPISEPFDQGIEAVRAMEAVSGVKVQSGCPFLSGQIGESTVDALTASKINPRKGPRNVQDSTVEITTATVIDTVASNVAINIAAANAKMESSSTKLEKYMDSDLYIAHVAEVAVVASEAALENKTSLVRIPTGIEIIVAEIDEKRFSQIDAQELEDLVSTQTREYFALLSKQDLREQRKENQRLEEVRIRVQRERCELENFQKLEIAHEQKTRSILNNPLREVDDIDEINSTIEKQYEDQSAEMLKRVRQAFVQ